MVINISSGVPIDGVQCPEKKKSGRKWQRTPCRHHYQNTAFRTIFRRKKTKVSGTEVVFSKAKNNNQSEMYAGGNHEAAPCLAEMSALTNQLRENCINCLPFITIRIHSPSQTGYLRGLGTGRKNCSCVGLDMNGNKSTAASNTSTPAQHLRKRRENIIPCAETMPGKHFLPNAVRAAWMTLLSQ